MPKDIEIEIQVRVEKTKQLMRFLKKNAKFSGSNHQIDTYYIPVHRDFTKARPVNEWLRLRDSSGEYSINYKNWHSEKDGKTYFCDEYESKIANIRQLKKIFRALDIRPLVCVDKIRKTYLYENFEVSIDKVKKLGDFIEIEYKGAEIKVKPKRITDKMTKFLKDNGCGRITRNYVGYPYQLLFPNDIKLENY